MTAADNASRLRAGTLAIAALAYGLMLMFLASATFKFCHLMAFIAMGTSLLSDTVPSPLAKYLAATVPVLELGAGVMLGVPSLRRMGAWCGGLLVLLFSWIIASRWSDETLSGCGCTWPFLQLGGTTKVATVVVRNLAIVAACAVVAIMTPVQPPET